MKLYGLTGGIGSGKSAAASFFAEQGAPVIDADQLAREIVEPGQPALAEVARHWPSVIDSAGRLDREKLARVVFADPEQRRALEGMLHPRIRAECRRRTRELSQEGHPYALYEAALIFETGGEGELDGVILVSASPETQKRRLAARGVIGPAEAARRMAAQLPPDEKRRRARWILENDGDLEALRAQVIALDGVLRRPG